MKHVSPYASKKCHLNHVSDKSVPHVRRLHILARKYQNIFIFDNKVFMLHVYFVKQFTHSFLCKCFQFWKVFSNERKHVHLHAREIEISLGE